MAHVAALKGREPSAWSLPKQKFRLRKPRKRPPLDTTRFTTG